MAVSISGNANKTVYGKGDICLKLNPFDNYRMFTLYEDWRSDDRKPINLADNQKIYLIFKSRNKEIRIPEYETINSDYSVDKVNGQVLFKINQKNAIDILAMDTRTFYITRVYETTNTAGDKIVSSDEEVMYTGMWKDESSNTIEEYSSQIKALNDLLESRNNLIKELQASNANLIEQNVNFATQLEEMKEENERLNNEISELEADLNKYESADEYDGVVLGSATHHTIISSKNYTEEQLKSITDQLETTMMD